MSRFYYMSAFAICAAAIFSGCSARTVHTPEQIPENIDTLSMSEKESVLLHSAELKYELEEEAKEIVTSEFSELKHSDLLHSKYGKSARFNRVLNDFRKSQMGEI